MICDVALCHPMCELDVCKFFTDHLLSSDSEDLVSCERGHVTRIAYVYRHVAQTRGLTGFLQSFNIVTKPDFMMDAYRHVRCCI